MVPVSSVGCHGENLRSHISVRHRYNKVDQFEAAARLVRFGSTSAPQVYGLNKLSVRVPSQEEISDRIAR